MGTLIKNSGLEKLGMGLRVKELGLGLSACGVAFRA